MNGQPKTMFEIVMAIIAMSLVVLLILFMIVVCIYEHNKSKKRAKRKGPITSSATVPSWLKGIGIGSYIKLQRTDIRIGCRWYEPYMSDGSKGVEYFQKIVNSRLANNDLDPITLPQDTWTVSIAMKNFKCGETCTDFTPISGMASKSYLCYQMLGKQMIQVTTYVEDGVEYVAGYCIYLRYPSCTEILYYHEHIKQLENSETYPDEQVQKNRHSRSTASRLQTVEEMTENLKVSICPITQKPVTIGWDNGMVKHFIWMEEYNTYKVVGCHKCIMETVQDNLPPRYSSLGTSVVMVHEY